MCRAAGGWQAGGGRADGEHRRRQGSEFDTGMLADGMVKDHEVPHRPILP